MTEQQISNWKTELENLAAAIHNNCVTLADDMTARSNLENQIEQERNSKIAQVAEARFEINNKLRYTNDTQRKLALAELEEADANFQALISGELTLREEIADMKALIEYDRKRFRAVELQMLYHATNGEPQTETV